MIISNIGTIVLSLPSRSPAFVDTPSTALVTTTQVRMLSVANTLSRLLVGPLADIVSPVPSRTIDGNRGFLKKHRISRTAFLSFSAAILVCTYAWMVVGVREQASIWALRSVSSPLTVPHDLTTYAMGSIGAGIAYGCAFTILYVPSPLVLLLTITDTPNPPSHSPSLVSSIWGLSNLGRNYGIITYAPFLGTPAFSYLYAFISAAHVSASEINLDGVCRGPGCWRLTFEVSALSAALAFGVSVYLWRAWKGRV